MEAVEIDQVNRPSERRRQIFDQVDPSLPVKRRCPGYSKIEVTLESGGTFGQRAKKGSPRSQRDGRRRPSRASVGQWRNLGRLRLA